MNNNSLFSEVNDYFEYSAIDLDIQETLKRTHIKNEVIFDNDEISIETYMYSKQNLDYITNYIYPFCKSEFFTNNSDDNTYKFNPFYNWSPEELCSYNLGLKDNTRCFELKISDITIGFCCILYLDDYDFSSPFSVFSEIFKDLTYLKKSMIFYNFVIEKPFRGLGYGKILLNEAIKYAKRNLNYDYITLYVDKDNISAKSLYEKYGFLQVCINPKDKEQRLYALKLT